MIRVYSRRGPIRSALIAGYFSSKGEEPPKMTSPRAWFVVWLLGGKITQK